jgi:hypothetical protein
MERVRSTGAVRRSCEPWGSSLTVQHRAPKDERGGVRRVRRARPLCALGECTAGRQGDGPESCGARAQRPRRRTADGGECGDGARRARTPRIRGSCASTVLRSRARASCPSTLHPRLGGHARPWVCLDGRVPPAHHHNAARTSDPCPSDGYTRTVFPTTGSLRLR